MTIAVLKERTKGENRVAVSPNLVGRYADIGQKIRIEKSAGAAAEFADEEYIKAGAVICRTPAETVQGAEIILKVQAPLPEEEKFLGAKPIVVADFVNAEREQRLYNLAKTGICGFALNYIPRISRAQSMDILSSQSNLAGYKAVLAAMNLLPKAAPLLMTAAGTVAPARVLVLGAGVAGLQAVATARRIGAVVYASDIRPDVQEQIESLGGKFVEIKRDKKLKTKGGYVQSASAEYLQRQRTVIAELLHSIDVVIATAFVAGKPAPQLIDAEMLKQMPWGSVVVDMAAAAGGNVEGSVDGKIITSGNVKIVGNGNLASMVPNSASRLYAGNVFNFLASQYDSATGKINFNYADEIVKSTCIMQGGKLLLKEGK